VGNYEQILKKYYPELVKAKPFPSLELLCDLLEKAIKFSSHRNELQDTEYFSYIWRPAIEDHPQNIGRDLKKVLVTGLRDTAEIQRIALHLLRIFPEQAKILITERLTNRELFEDVDVQHEYVLLLRENFSILSEKDKQTILKWIEEGPDIERFKKRVQETTNREPSEEEIKRYRDIWQRDRLAWIGPENLPKVWRNRYGTLVQQYGEPEHPEFPVYTFSWTGPTSPLDAEELKEMSVEEIVEFLKSWIPPENIYGGPSPEKLGQVLSSVVAEDPQRFAEKANLFCGLDPTYVRALLSGFKEALREHRKTFDWEQVLKLCQWVVDQSREIPDRKADSFEVDPDWGWTRKEITNLLSIGLQSKEGEIPIKYRKEVWNILLTLTEDPEPSPKDEINSEMDPATLSINTVRGLALHAVIRYALWVRRYSEEYLCCIQ